MVKDSGVACQVIAKSRIGMGFLLNNEKTRERGNEMNAIVSAEDRNEME